MTETTQRQARMPSGAHQVISVCEAAKDKLEEVIGYMETQRVSSQFSIRIDWFALLAVQGILKGLLQHHSAFFMIQLTSIHDDWKNHSLDQMDLCQQSVSLLFNMLSRFVIAFRPRSKHLLISWLQSPSAVILEPPQNKICHCFHCFPSICHEVMGLDAMILVF